MLEEDLKRLEEIAKILAKSKNLDESLKLYEEGCALAQKCLKELDDAKGKLVMIKKNNQDKDEDEGKDE